MSFPGPALRRVVLAGAVVAALVAGATLPARMVAAQSPASEPAAKATAPAPAAAANPSGSDAASPADKEGGSAPPKSAASKGVRIGISVDADKPEGDAAGDAGKDAQSGDIVIEKKNKRVHVRGLGRDRDFDSFDQMMTNEPTAGMVVAIVAIVFLSPALIVGLVVWYRMRKARMLNETVLKLAERGALPPADAVQALTMGQLPPASAFASGTVAPPGNVAGATALTEVRRAAIKSDLRKAIILAALGIAFTMHSTYDGGSPNIVGLILLFLGIGYGVLWWFESRQIDAASGSPPAGSGPAGPSAAP